MILHNPFRSLDLRLVAGCLLLINWSDTASARDFDLRYRQNQVVAKPLQVLPDTYSDQTCPEHFRLVRLSAEIDLNQVVTIFADRDLPIVSRNDGKVNTSIVSFDKSVAIDVRIDLIGCVFQRHFLPQNGQVILSGDFGVGRIENADFLYSPDGRKKSLRLSYITRLSGPVSSFVNEPIKAGQSRSDEHVMGLLSLFFPRLQLPISSDSIASEVAHISDLYIKILILSAEAAE